MRRAAGGLATWCTALAGAQATDRNPPEPQMRDRYGAKCRFAALWGAVAPGCSYRARRRASSAGTSMPPPRSA